MPLRLGPLTLFVMAWRMTAAAGYSFWAALAYSLTSPARALLRDPDFHPSLLWTSRRLYTMAVHPFVRLGASRISLEPDNAGTYATIALREKLAG